MKEKTQLVYISVFIMSTSYENCLFEGDPVCQYGSWMFVGIYWFQEHIFVYTQIELELWAKYIHILSCWDLSRTCWHTDKKVDIVLLRTTYFLRNIEAAHAVFLDLFKWHLLFKAFRVWKRKKHGSIPKPTTLRILSLLLFKDLPFLFPPKLANCWHFRFSGRERIRSGKPDSVSFFNN